MGKIFFIADTHFGDRDILRYESRPFGNVFRMENSLTAQWNSTVGCDDEVYVLGDFGEMSYLPPINSVLNGKMYLVKGNHDEFANEYYRNIGFCEVYDKPVILNDFWILSHEPVYVNKHMPYVNIFGHVHNSPVIKDASPQHFCVSAERIEYRPISFDEIRKRIKDETIKRARDEMRRRAMDEI